MGKTTYSIRKGFEYQDLYCALVLLDALEERALDATFQIESDEVDHVDDLVICLPGRPPTGNQVKFHTTQDYVESIETLTHRETANSKSLIEKLFKGWRQLSNDGERPCRINFVSSNGVVRGRWKLGSAIETATGTLGDKFFGHADYKKSREALAGVLNVQEGVLEAFLRCVAWKFSYESIDGLRGLVTRGLRRINLPTDDAAVSQLMELIAYCATEHKGDLTLRGFLQKLWECSRFREACEQQFAGFEWGGKDKRRAHRVRVAFVKLDCLPAYSGTKFVCSEEPLPLPDYRNGLTVPGLASTFGAQRTAWRTEYQQWNLQRIQALLPALERLDIDILLFPRFSLDLEGAATVAQWCKARNCNASVGGHSLPILSSQLSRYESDLGVAVDWQSRKPEELEDRVIDVVFRCGRAGRYGISEMQSPYSTTEMVESDVSTFELECRDGWITVASLPSPTAFGRFSGSGGHSPELVLASCGVHADSIVQKAQHEPAFQNVPLALCSASLNAPPVLLASTDAERATSASDEWEGICVYQVDYARSVATGWHATATIESRIPVVYHGAAPPTELQNQSGWVDAIQGAAESRSEAVAEIRRDGKAVRDGKVLVIIGEDPASFFVRRASQADAAIRAHIMNAPPDEIELLVNPMRVIAEIREKRERSIVEGQTYASVSMPPAAPRMLSFVDRAEQRRTVARFADSASDKRLLLLHGPAGIGKRALLIEAQRTDPRGTSWVRFHCAENAAFSETLAQLMIRLGSPQSQPLEPNLASYEAVCRQFGAAKVRVLVLEDAHNLPIDSSHAEHASLLEFLAFLCKTDLQPRPKVLLVSEWRGHLSFSGSHLMDTVRLEGLDLPDMLTLLQELAASAPSKYPPATVGELEVIARKTHGHPFIGQLAIAAMENSPPSEVIEKLHQREEVRHFVINRLLGRVSLSQIETRFLQLAAVFRIPVLASAFSGVAGAQTNAIIDDLVNRFLLTAEGNSFKLHPLLCDCFKSQDARGLHRHAYQYFDAQRRMRKLTLDENVQLVFHAFSSGTSVRLDDLQLFTGSIRTAMFDALNQRDWPRVRVAGEQILQIIPNEAVAKVAIAVALDATGESTESEQYFDSVGQLDAKHLWVAITFAKSRIRRRDFDGAERILEELEQRFGAVPAIQTTRAQLSAKAGLVDDAVQRCEDVLTGSGCKERDAFNAGLILRDLDRLDVLIGHVEANYASGISHPGLYRLYGYACVVTNHAPDEGLQMLSDLWSAEPNDGYVVADYAAALSMTGRTADARQLFDRGLQESRGVKSDRRTLIEENALFQLRSGNVARAHEAYRELLRLWPYELHNHRRFAQSLFDAAAAARADGSRGSEDASLQEAEQVIRRLLEIAPADRWAAEFLIRVQQRAY